MDRTGRRTLNELVETDKYIELFKHELKRVRPDLRTRGFWNSLLDTAMTSKFDNPLVVEHLIKIGADIDKTHSFSNTALHYAVIHRKCRVVELILKHTRRINYKNMFHKTALHYAVKNDFCGIPAPSPRVARLSKLVILIRLLNHKDINVDVQDSDGYTPLFRAIEVKQLKMVKLLLNKNPRLNVVNKFGENALHVALLDRDPCPSIVTLLLFKRVSLLAMNGKDEIVFNILVDSPKYSFEFVSTCLTVIAYLTEKGMSDLLLMKLKKQEKLYHFFLGCIIEIRRMRRDIIKRPDFTLLHFFVKFPHVYGFANPIKEIYAPVIQRLIRGAYPYYFSYILKRISCRDLYAVFRHIIAEKYCNCVAMGCKKKHSTGFSILQNIALFKYLTIFDMFCLIAGFNIKVVPKSMRDFRVNKCYLPDSWDIYQRNLLQMRPQCCDETI